MEMTDLQNKNIRPNLEEMAEYTDSPLFMQFCGEIMERYGCTEKIEYSACSMERGWNVKFRKAGRTLCTIYPRECFFTVMVVVGPKQRQLVEEILPECSEELREIYNSTREGSGQRWLMMDVEDRGELYNDILRLIEIRRGRKE